MTEFAGTLRERVTIEQPISLRNEMGLREPGWQQVCSCLAAITLESIGPQSQAQALSAMPIYQITIRRRDDITVDQRVTWKTRSFVVRQLLDDPRAKDRIVMRCEEVRT
jgi:SPP1 family predicted phage head-tail adaptor